jgi:hypothetical protein
VGIYTSGNLLEAAFQRHLVIIKMVMDRAAAGQLFQNCLFVFLGNAAKKVCSVIL